MSAAPSPPTADIAAESLRSIGEMVCLYVQLELAMRRFVDLLYPTGVTDTDGSLSRRAFEPPLRILKVLVFARYASEPRKLRKFRRWRNRVNKLLERRNRMIHGAWIDEHGQLRFRCYPRCEDARMREEWLDLSAHMLASDMRRLAVDIATIKAWISGYTPAT